MEIPYRRLDVAANSHWHDGSSLMVIQAGWVLGLLPASVAGVLHHGWPGLRVLALAVAVSVLTDILASRSFGGKDHPENLSSVTLGLLLGMLLPVTTPWWLVVLGSVLLVVVGKKMFGGWGGWPVHPVALVFAMLLVSWPGHLDYTAADLVHEPVRVVRSLGAAAAGDFSILDILRGQQACGVANGQGLWLLVGGILAAALGSIPWRIPLGFLVGTALTSWLLQALGVMGAAPPLLNLVAGSTLFSAFFLATDHTTAPVYDRPQVVYGLLGGMLLVLIRTFGLYADGAVFTILLLNLTSPLLDRWAPASLGLEEESHA
jgi:electron transport complex protein RnfD